MWSDPPATAEDWFCSGWCTDAGLERLNALLDDPVNDTRPFDVLSVEADDFQRERHQDSRGTAIDEQRRQRARERSQQKQ